jgi:TatA/E family protein of Tat protein translocase
MFTLGVPEMVVIFVLALVLFGPKKLPELGRTIGKAMTEFRRASNDLKSTFEREMHTLERETQDIQVTARQTAREIADHASYDLAPSENLWNALENVVNEPAPVQEQNPEYYVGASEVSGAESTVEAAVTAEPAEHPVPAGETEPERPISS